MGAEGVRQLRNSVRSPTGRADLWEDVHSREAFDPRPSAVAAQVKPMRSTISLTSLSLSARRQGFADPFNFDRPFIYPQNTGISYSFTDDGYFEEAQVS